MTIFSENGKYDYLRHEFKKIGLNELLREKRKTQAQHGKKIYFRSSLMYKIWSSKLQYITFNRRQLT